jgi:class 3 adenylate cyclase
VERRGHFLHRALLTHLAVALPPAVALGYFVIDANRSGLVEEAQNVHLALATRVDEAIAAELDARVGSLEEAERILDADELPFERRRVLLRAIVAAGRASQIAIYDAEGALDSRVAVESGQDQLPSRLDEETRRRARVERFTPGRLEPGASACPVVVAWRRGDETLGYLAAPLEIKRVEATVRTLRDRFLGVDGEVDVVDGTLTYIASSRPDASGVASTESPFVGFERGSDRPLLGTLEAGVVQRIETERGPVLVAAVSVPKLGWHVGVSRPESAALASLERVRRRVWLLALVAALAAGIVALWLARHVTEPIRRLTSSVRRAARDGFRGSVDTRATAEIAVLRDAFNEALEVVEHHRRASQSTTQLRLRMARFLPPTVLHQLLTKEFRVVENGTEEDVALLYIDLADQDRWNEGSKENLVAVLGELYAAACGALEDAGGRIDHFSGDAIIGIFTASAHADYARNAAMAAVAVLASADHVFERWTEQGRSTSVTISMGIAVGRAIVGRVDAANEISVVGPLVAEAADLQQVAKPSTAVVNVAAAQRIGADLIAHPRLVHVRSIGPASPTSDIDHRGTNTLPLRVVESPSEES